MDTEMDDSIIELNVGGQLVSTLSSTLNKESKIFNHMSYDKNGRQFLDCDFDVFKCVLDFLRNKNNMPTPEMTLKVYDLAKDIECESLVEKLESYHAVKYRIEMEKKREMVNQKYEELKKTVINGIENLNVDPGEDKAVHLCGQSIQTCCKPAKYGGFRARDVILYANFTCYSNFLDDDEFLLLAYDLATLGFAKYVIKYKHDNKCDTCGQRHDWQVILLLSHRK